MQALKTLVVESTPYLLIYETNTCNYSQIPDEIMQNFVEEMAEEGNNNEANQQLLQQNADNFGEVVEGFHLKYKN